MSFCDGHNIMMICWNNWHIFKSQTFFTPETWSLLVCRKRDALACGYPSTPKASQWKAVIISELYKFSPHQLPSPLSPFFSKTFYHYFQDTLFNRRRPMQRAQRAEWPFLLILNDFREYVSIE